MSESWRLKLGEETLGVLTKDRLDQPSMFCHFEPAPAFEQYKPLFAEELRLLNLEKMDLWEQAYRKIISPGFTLEPVGKKSQIIKDFILHIEGNEAWFRW
ncbi:MAG: hypothetical protein GY832_15295 [Chloroflexi bacterium]|nr:hypothetical protein [Chloroflexota bacterium]